MKKYKFTGETMVWYGYKLHRIIALRDFGEVKKGDIGGWIEKEDNLSHEGNCWVYDDSKVLENAEVRDNAQIKEYSIVRGSAQIFDNAIVEYGYVYDDAWIFESAMIINGSRIYNSSMIFGNAKISNEMINNGHHIN